MGRNRRESIAWSIAALLAVIGLIVVVVGLHEPASFGWFAYQPNADAVFAPGAPGFFVSRMTLTGAVMLAAGSIGIAFFAGRRTGVRQADPRGSAHDDS